MFKTDVPTAATALPAPSAAGAPGYFTNGDPAHVPPVPRTVLDADYMNMLMMEVYNVVVFAGLTPSKTTYTQLLSAIQALLAAGTDGSLTAIASAATTNLGSSPTRNVAITGAVTISSFGASAVATQPIYTVVFNNSLTLTNSATLNLPGGQDIVTQGGDNCIALYQGGSTWTILAYFRHISPDASLLKAANLSDLANVGTALANLGITLKNLPKAWFYCDNTGAVLNSSDPHGILNAVTKSSGGTFEFGFSGSGLPANYSTMGFCGSGGIREAPGRNTAQCTFQTYDITNGSIVDAGNFTVQFYY